LKGEFLRYVKDFKAINKRLCWLRLKAKWFSCTLINVHVQTNKKTKETNKEFNNLLEQTISQIASSDIHTVRGDSNAKIGKENVYKPTIGNESLHNETNDNGMKMIQFAVSRV
jgi:hypothetical protein